MPKLSPEERLFKTAYDQVRKTWSIGAFNRLGHSLQRSLLCEELLFVLVEQEMSNIPPDRLQYLIRYFWMRAGEATDA